MKTNTHELKVELLCVREKKCNSLEITVIIFKA